MTGRSAGGSFPAPLPTGALGLAALAGFLLLVPLGAGLACALADAGGACCTHALCLGALSAALVPLLGRLVLGVLDSEVLCNGAHRAT